MRSGDCGFTLLELLIVVAIIGIISAIAVPGLLRARMSRQETSAIGSLRAVNAAESTYAATFSLRLAAFLVSTWVAMVPSVLAQVVGVIITSRAPIADGHVFGPRGS